MHVPVRIVLVETSHPGNIGASARAMKTMGLTELALVRPHRFPSADASARASGADDVLTGASVSDTLADAVADCSLVVGASARPRSVAWQTWTPRDFARAAVQHAALSGARSPPAPAPVAVVFGPEQSGLTNDDLARCSRLVQIPTNPEYGSLNLAMAVQVLCYELRVAWLHARGAPPVTDERAQPPATGAEIEGLHEHLERILFDAGFLHPDHPHQLKLKLRRIFHRAALDREDVNILRGMIAALDPRRAGRSR